jgi:hypothetical protein
MLVKSFRQQKTPEVANNLAEFREAFTMRSIAISFFTMITVTGQFAASQEVDGTIRQANQKWNEYRKLIDDVNLQKKGSTTTKGIAGNDSKELGSIESVSLVKLWRGNAAITQFFPATNTSSAFGAQADFAEAFGTNSAYEFHLKKAGRSDDWRLMKHTIFTDKLLKPKKEVDLIRARAVAEISQHFEFDNQFIGDFFKKKTVALESVSRSRNGNIELVHVKFSKKMKIDKGSVDAKCEIVLCPELFWSITESSIAFQTDSMKFRATDKCTAQADSAGIPILTSYTFVADTAIGEGFNRVTRKTGDYKYISSDSPLSEADFTTAAFGIREFVTETPPPPNRNFLWITLASIAAVIVAILVRRKIKSLEAKAS